MQVTDVRIRKVAAEGKMKAIVSVTFDDEFVVHDIKIIEGQNGLFIAMPSRKMGEGDFRDIAHPAVAPIGAVVGEWVGSSAGLGYLMLHSNARLQIDLMFAALLVLAAMAVTLYFTIDLACRRILHWQPETDHSDQR